MKEEVWNKSFNSQRSNIGRYAALAAVLIFLAELLAETPPSGYLSKGTPQGLRFSQQAKPAKPAVPHLEPRGIAYNPPALFVSEFAAPPTSTPVSIQTNSVPSIVKRDRVTIPEQASARRTLQTNSPLVRAEANLVTHQSLVKYFEVKKPHGVGKTLSELSGLHLSATEISPTPSAKARPE